MSRAIDALKAYLSQGGDHDVPDTGQPFVTVSRADGVESHEVARAIVRQLDDLPDKGWNRGWELMDQQLCAWLIKAGNVPATLDELVAEHYGEKALRQMMYEMLVGSAEEHGLCRKVGEVTRLLIRVGRTVVVGSAAAPEAATAKGPGVRVRVVASESHRVANVAVAQQTSPEAARKLIVAHDAARARLLSEHYQRAIDDHALYDVSFFADRLAPKEMARAVVALLAARMDAAARRTPLSATQVLSLV